MPPPPAPAGKAVMLEREANALSSCFKNAVVKTGQIYAFHADTRRLGVHKYAPYPPRTLTASLGRELEKYGQLCDAIELQLLRAMSILKRDLTREERRAREAEQAAIAAQAPKFPVPSIEAGEVLPSSTPVQGSPQGPTQHISMRRPSAISLSSLNRSALKLDLSSSSMRISAEEVALFPKGLVPSPVSLAPKSARPLATADIDLMAAFASAAAANSDSQRVDIDLTDSPPAMMAVMDSSLGSTADKPIELDLDNIDMEMSDMTNLFGDAPESTSGDGQTAVDSLFSPATADSGAPLPANEVPRAQKEGAADAHINLALLGAFQTGHGGQGENLFGSVASGSTDGNQQPHSASSVAPSPSLSSGFPQAGMQSGVGGFDLSTLDLSAWQNIDVEAFLNMPSTGSNPEGHRAGENGYQPTG
ncbi:hypothetical protein L210DRAFT_3628830 [Boletus edulis BED1]|uniref:Uncharacterized protein n=1 Tax=Boletus edulis BED1 TaxID=1328754 RepID=A0AAD4GIY3_BOLED|nr:hypothetical protein L210DRAFT_3628830 [Boletus edulis BED1]